MVMTTQQLKDPDRPVRVLVVAPMLLQPIGEAAVRPCAAGEQVTLPLRDARIACFADASRMLYLDAADAPSAELFASAEAIQRVERQVELERAARDEREQRHKAEAGGPLTPAMLQQIAAIVAAALQQGRKP